MTASAAGYWRRGLNRLLRFTDRVAAPALPLPFEEVRSIQERFRFVSASYRKIFEALREGARSTQSEQGAGQIAYPWVQWERDLAAAFSNEVPLSFLEHPIVKATMVFHGRSHHSSRLRTVRQVYGYERAERLLIEDPVGRPHLCGRAPVTSPNRLHHAAHLAHYSLATGKSFSAQPTIVEWGGGYGDAARLARRLNSTVTYVIVDLPAVGALQYVYLSAVVGAANVHVIATAATPLRRGAINITTSAIAFRHPELAADSFLSTWALTESPRELQEQVVSREFFGAKNILLAFSMDDDNHVVEAMQRNRGAITPVPYMTAEGYAASYYGFI